MDAEDGPYPQYAVTSMRTPPDRAARMVDQFLARAQGDATLHSNPLLTQRGPVARAGGAQADIALHNLGRVAGALRGVPPPITAPDVWGASLALDGANEGAVTVETAVEEAPAPTAAEMAVEEVLVPASKRKKKDKGKGEAKAEAHSVAAEGDAAADWQDKEAWEREQDMETGEVGTRGVEAMRGEEARPEAVMVEDGAKRKLTAEEKAARKAAKKEKRKREKVAKNA